jgi:hypothetical protein
MTVTLHGLDGGACTSARIGLAVPVEVEDLGEPSGLCFPDELCVIDEDLAADEPPF